MYAEKTESTTNSWLYFADLKIKKRSCLKNHKI